jgi:DNA-directed RNA polymerase subunit RPC12/RpoP
MAHVRGVAMVSVKCPHCGASQELPLTGETERIICSSCSKGFRVLRKPSPEVDGAPSPPPVSRVQRVLSSSTPTGPVGIRGWLIVPAVLLVFWALSLIGELVGTWPLDSPFVESAHSTYLVWRKLVNAACLAFVLYVAHRFSQRHPTVPTLMIALLVTQVTANVVFAVWAHAISGEGASAYGLPLLPKIMLVAVLIPYFVYSKRVKATFNTAQFEARRQAAPPEQAAIQAYVLRSPAACTACGKYLREGLLWHEFSESSVQCPSCGQVNKRPDAPSRQR